MNNNGSAFVVIEGPRGAGKSTVIRKIQRAFASGEIPGFKSFVATREVGGTPEGEHIRELFSDFTNSQMDGHTELLLITAARRHHLNEVILPMLTTPQTLVVCDRFILSTFAFQCGWRGVSSSTLMDLHEDFCYGYNPDLTIYLDVPPEVSIERTASRTHPVPDTEKSREILASIHKAYSILISPRILRVDATQSEEKVWQDVYEILLNYLGE